MGHFKPDFAFKPEFKRLLKYCVQKAGNRVIQIRTLNPRGPRQRADQLAEIWTLNPRGPRQRADQLAEIRTLNPRGPRQRADQLAEIRSSFRLPAGRRPESQGPEDSNVDIHAPPAGRRISTVVRRSEVSALRTPGTAPLPLPRSASPSIWILSHSQSQVWLQHQA